MPRVEHGPLTGNYLPDYSGGSTVNLMATIIQACGGHSPHAPLGGLPRAGLETAQSVVYLVLDGLGWSQLQRHLGAGRGRGFFAQHAVRPISTVFPATTAAAVTTFDTGASPGEHAILSWYLHLPDLGVLSTVLRTTTKLGAPLVPPGFDLRAYYDVPSYVETVDAELNLLSFGDIPNVPFADVGTRWPRRRAYRDLEGMVANIVALAQRSGGRRLSYAYWPTYDRLCHELGIEHPDVAAHFDALDAALNQLVVELRGQSVALCVLADHGLLDVVPERYIDLAKVDGLMDCLATAPAGDQRQLSCMVRPRAEARFLALVERELGDACVCVPQQEMLELGAFGPGTPHRALRQRLGDFVLLCRPGWALIHTPPGMEPMTMLGSHGGMSEAEIRVPLYVVYP